MRGALRQRVERLTRELEEPILTGADVFALFDGIVRVVRRHVTDPQMLSAIASDLRHMSKGLGDR